LLIGNPAKAKKILDWEPKVRFKELVQIMVDADLELLSRTTVQKHLGKLP
jgi:GDPmannose 4,6-dehydratase